MTIHEDYSYSEANVSIQYVLINWYPLASIIIISYITFNKQANKSTFYLKDKKLRAKNLNRRNSNFFFLNHNTLQE